jgi:hypothetical protein
MFGSKIKLDKDLLNQCKHHAQEAGYSSVEEFITHTLEKELRKKTKQPAVKTDKEMVKQLKGLGYID